MPLTLKSWPRFQSQVLRYTALAISLPTLLVTPGQAGMLLLHRHCDASTHAHRFDHADLNAWRDDHARQHPCDGPDHHDTGWPDDASNDFDCDHDTPTLVLTKVHLSRPLRSGDAGALAQKLATGTAVAALLAPFDREQASGLPPANVPRADLATLDATAALLLRNHALLL